MATARQIRYLMAMKAKGDKPDPKRAKKPPTAYPKLPPTKAKK